jgi:plasmid maintenance system antidote protein VapI
MLPEIDKVIGVHPGAILERELHAQKLRKGRFALQIQEYPQTLSAITKGTRGISTALSIKLGRALHCDFSYFNVLQAYYDVETEKKRQFAVQQNKPDLTRLRTGLFWDSNLVSIDWQKNSGAVIMRVFERGNQDEIREITRFYGKELVTRVLKDTPSRFPAVKDNAHLVNIKI